MRTGIVTVPPTYRIIEEDSSLIAVIKAIIAPAKTPGNIKGSVILTKVLAGPDPRLAAASSIPILICFKIDTPERTEYGKRRIKITSIIIIAVPVRTTGLLLNDTIKPSPSTTPGTIYGIINMESSDPVRIDGYAQQHN